MGDRWDDIASAMFGRAINGGVAGGAVEAGVRIRLMFFTVADEGEQN
jgi:hypothetical protein